MKRQDYIIFFLLIGMLFAWPNIYRKFFADKNPAPAPAEKMAVDAVSDAESAVVQESIESASDGTGEIVREVKQDAVIAEVEEEDPAAEAQFATLSNEQVELSVSTLGASIVSVTLNEFRESLPKDSGPVFFDFSGMPALAYSGIPGLSSRNDYKIISQPDAASIVLERSVGDGLVLRREMMLGQDYLITVNDTFVNETTMPVAIGKHQVQLGVMTAEEDAVSQAGVINMGVDSLPPAKSVQNWGKKIPKQFKNEQENQQLGSLPNQISWKTGTPAEWVSAKNKYFIQILKSDGAGADWFEIYARREISAEEQAGGRPPKSAVVEGVSASLGFDSQFLPPGEEYTRTFEYYVGPKSFRILSQLSHGREAAMGFEENAYMDFITVPAAKILIRLLDWIHDHVYANYGVAIILLTLIVRIVFWPITHKGTESMRRMSSVQPLMKEINEKYKDNPQKKQQAMMALYKEHKINPIGGCLPMLVQIPVFFALFVVLRIAIELRFAEFLWIKDLSGPENLVQFGFTIPLLGWSTLNILPLLMTATMIIQQKMTPTAGDAQQQKMMMIMMPAMMLFFLYNFASGLALYWTTQNFLMIVQQYVYKKRKARQEAAA